MFNFWRKSEPVPTPENSPDPEEGITSEIQKALLGLEANKKDLDALTKTYEEIEKENGGTPSTPPSCPSP